MNIDNLKAGDEIGDFVLVPKEPTNAMLQCIAWKEWDRDWQVGKDAQARGTNIWPKMQLEEAYGQYRRMIDAAIKGYEYDIRTAHLWEAETGRPWFEAPGAPTP